MPELLTLDELAGTLKRERKKTMPELLTIDELADTLRVEKSWVYRQTMRKDADAIPRLKMGKYLRFRMDAVMAWLESQQSN